MKCVSYHGLAQCRPMHNVKRFLMQFLYFFYFDKTIFFEPPDYFLLAQ